MEWTIQHVTDYLDGRIDIREFWDPIPGVLAFYFDHDYPEEPDHRLAYFWRRNSFNVRSIVQSGHTDMEAGYRQYLRLWLDALRKPEDEWQDVVKRKGWALEDIDPDWDK